MAGAQVMDVQNGTATAHAASQDVGGKLATEKAISTDEALKIYAEAKRVLNRKDNDLSGDYRKLAAAHNDLDARSLMIMLAKEKTGVVMNEMGGFFTRNNIPLDQAEGIVAQRVAERISGHNQKGVGRIAISAADIDGGVAPGTEAKGAANEAAPGAAAAPAATGTDIDDRIRAFVSNGEAQRIAAKPSHHVSQALKDGEAAQASVQRDIDDSLRSIEASKLQAIADMSPAAAARINALGAQLQTGFDAITSASAAYNGIEKDRVDAYAKMSTDLSQQRAELSGRRRELETELKTLNGKKTTPETLSDFNDRRAAYEKDNKDFGERCAGADAAFNKEWDTKMDVSLKALYDARTSLAAMVGAKRDASGAFAGSAAQDKLSADISGIAQADSDLAYFLRNGKTISPEERAFLNSPTARKYEAAQSRTVEFLAAHAGEMSAELQSALKEGRAVDRSKIDLKNRDEKAYADIIDTMFKEINVLPEKARHSYDAKFSSKVEHIAKTVYGKIEKEGRSPDTSRFDGPSDRVGKRYGADELEKRLDKAMDPNQKHAAQEVAKAWNAEYVLSTDIGRKKTFWQHLTSHVFSSRSLIGFGKNVAVGAAVGWAAGKVVDGITPDHHSDRNDDGDNGSGSGY